ncbi:agarase [Alteromonas lipotrueae]|uniref:agarase n=1 Tax=Alteromonas lipotrueae TaxID=2803814 RepID=UPI001C45B554|nr:agarase [Alteromonas lipotrueae]
MPSHDVITELYTFEAPLNGEIKTENVSANIQSSPSGSGSALRLNFKGDVAEASVKLIPEKNWDWSKHEEINLAFDAINTEDESIQLYIGVKAENGDEASHSVIIPAHSESTYYFVLKGKVLDTDLGYKRSRMEAWQSDEQMAHFRIGTITPDLSSVKELRLFTRDNMVSKQLLVDNIRLRENPEYTNDYRKNIVDKFGQSAKHDFPLKVHSEAELKEKANAELSRLNASSPLPDRSRFGGWKDGPKLEATGYFRTHEMKGKWWLVDPDGYLFFSNGLSNVRMANLTTLTGIDFKDESVRYVDPEAVTPEDSMGIVEVSDEVRDTRFVASDVRHDMFEWLPNYDDELADHYSYRRSVHHGPLTSGETFSFYRANLERRYGEPSPKAYEEKWQQVTLDRFQDWGFTSMGNWVDPAFYPNQQVPYFANGWIIGDFKTLSSKHDVWGSMPDSFDPEFVRRANVTITQIADEIQSSPWCIGVFVDNEKSWGRTEGSLEHRYGLILDALSKPIETSPAKAAFVKALKQKYASISELNNGWQTSFTNWQDLDNSWQPEHDTSSLEQDLSMMLEMLSDQYFKFVHSALEKALPNHLYMGARMASWGMPDETITAAVRYSDVLSFNIYKEGVQPSQWSFIKDIDLPSIIGEFHIGTNTDSGLYHPGLVAAADQKDRAKMYQQYMQSVADHPNMVGAHWFQYVDSPITGRAFDGENYNVGFVSVTDIPYKELVDSAREFNRTLYPERFNQE